MQSSIKYRLFRSFLLLVALPVFVVVLAINLLYYINTKQTIVHQGETITKEIAASLDEQFARYESLLDFIERDDMILANRDFDSEYVVPYKNYLQLVRLLEAYAISLEGIDSISLLYENNYFVNTDKLYPHHQDLNESDWYLSSLREPNRMIVFCYPTGTNPMLGNTPHYSSSLSICKAICDAEGRPYAVVNLTVRGDYFGRILTAAYSQQGGQSYLVNCEGSLVNSPLQLSELPGLQDPGYLVTRKKLNDMPFEIINVLPIKKYQSSQLSLVMLAILGSFAFMVVFFIQARYTSRQFLQPIEDLRRLMQEAQHGNLQVSFNPQTGDEFEDLAQSFNRMVAELRQLIRQVYVEQSNKRRAEIAALQANIKPHFLYNTLETIHWMARRRNADEIVEAVDALSDLFRVGFSSNHELGTIRLEFTHVESYLKIQKLRYADILDYELEIDPAVENLPLQKTILQPVVENALYHGIKESGHAGKITITAGLSEGDIVLTIQDNGVGLSPEALEHVRRLLEKAPDPKKQHGSGLANVHQRLMLSYGSRYGLSIDSVLNQGTTVTLRHPVILSNPEEQHEI